MRTLKSPKMMRERAVDICACTIRRHGPGALSALALLTLIALAPMRLCAQGATTRPVVPPDSPPPSGEVMAPVANASKTAPASAAIPAVASVSPASTEPPADTSDVATTKAAQSASADKKDSGSSNTPFSPFGGAQKGPVNIQSDGLNLDYKNNWVLFHGLVHAVQAGGELNSDSLKVKYGKDFSEVQQMVADGNVRISQGTRWATSDHAVLDQAVHTVTLTGSPVVHDGNDRVVGQKIVLNLITGKSEVTGGAKAWFFPRDSKSPNNEGAATGAAD
jgi:lipopolysaccharide export system protein LptA